MSKESPITHTVCGLFSGQGGCSTLSYGTHTVVRLLSVSRYVLQLMSIQLR